MYKISQFIRSLTASLHIKNSKYQTMWYIRSMTLPKCQYTTEQYHLFWYLLFLCVITLLTSVYTAVLYINICCFLRDFRPVVNINYVTSPKFAQSQKVLVMSAVCVSKFQSFYSSTTKQHDKIILWDTLHDRLPTNAVYTLPQLNLRTEYR